MTRVAVVGAGVMGCAAAWALAERGADVTLIEQFELDHARGSSHGRTRIFRLAYPEAHWVQLAEEALAGWRELERRAGRELLGLHGLVELCSSARADVAPTCSTRAASSTGCSTATRSARTASCCRTAGRRSGSRTRASCSPTRAARVPRRRTAGASRRAPRRVARRRRCRRRRRHRRRLGDEARARRAGARDARDGRVLRARRRADAVGRRARRGDARITRCTRCTTPCTG